MDEIRYAILGYGGRGSTFASIAKCPEMQARIVAVAEPDPDRRDRAGQDNGLPPEMLFESAADLVAQPKLADAIINTTMDRLHAETSIPAMRKGYHLLLEKPMAATLEDCETIEAAQRRTGVIVAVCHSLRHLPIYVTLKRLIDDGTIGEVVSFDHVEGVGDVHYTSSFVRGNWGNESGSSFMLLQKSCHDIDLFDYLMGRVCRRVSSFGSLTYFTSKNKPEGAPARCLDGCPEEATCPYHCRKVYIEDPFWRFVFPRQDDASVWEYLRTGPYGRCVFQSDNNVVDHQVVSLEYEGGLTGVFTMVAFHPGDRLTRVYGTKGFLEAALEGQTIDCVDFVSRNKTTSIIPSIQGGHGGGDYLVLRNLTEAIRNDHPGTVLTSAQESLRSHRIVFAAERSRIEGKVAEIP